MAHRVDEMVEKVHEFSTHVRPAAEVSGPHTTAVNSVALEHWRPGSTINALYAAQVARSAAVNPSRAYRLGLTTDSSGIIGQLVGDQRTMVDGSQPQTNMQPQAPGDSGFDGSFVTNAWQRMGGNLSDLERLTYAEDQAAARNFSAALTLASRVGGASPSYHVSGVSSADCC